MYAYYLPSDEVNGLENNSKLQQHRNACTKNSIYFEFVNEAAKI